MICPKMHFFYWLKIFCAKSIKLKLQKLPIKRKDNDYDNFSMLNQKLVTDSSYLWNFDQITGVINIEGGCVKF